MKIATSLKLTCRIELLIQILLLLYNQNTTSSWWNEQKKHFYIAIAMWVTWYLTRRQIFFCSETGCSFARHFAILSRNVGILIGSLLRASCDSNFNLLPEQTVFHIGILWVDCDMYDPPPPKNFLFSFSWPLFAAFRDYRPCTT